MTLREMSVGSKLNTGATSPVTITMKKQEEQQRPKKTPDIEKLPTGVRRFLEEHPYAALVEDDGAFVLPQGGPGSRKSEESEPEDDE